VKSGALVRKGTLFLKETGDEVSRLEAEVLLAHCWGQTRLDLLVYPEREVPTAVSAAFHVVLERRAMGVPVAYLTGEREFMSLSFFVTPAVLIPRPETELLVETILQHLKAWPPGKSPVRVADVGTGSGAVAVSLACYQPRAHLLATDISGEALAVAGRNVRRHAVEERVRLRQGDLLAPVLAGDSRDGAAVCANLPYIPAYQIPGLPPDVRCEPALALDGGADGLDLYRRLIPQAARWLAPGGLLACEIGEGQGSVMTELLVGGNWNEISVLPDYRGQERLVTAVRTTAPDNSLIR
jgi:release factor glutamine methyltransferase